LYTVTGQNIVVPLLVPDQNINLFHVLKKIILTNVDFIYLSIGKIIIDYYVAFFILHVISTRDVHISPRAEGQRANKGRRLIWHLIIIATHRSITHIRDIYALYVVFTFHVTMWTGKFWNRKQCIILWLYNSTDWINIYYIRSLAKT
jgi:hypothetical protein